MTEEQPMQAITFRLPPAVIDKLDEIAELAAQQSAQPVVVADVYRWAFGRYLAENGRGVQQADGTTSQVLDAELAVYKLEDMRMELELRDEPTRTVCVHIPAEMRQRFDELLEAQRRSAGILALARSFTVSQLYAAAVGALLLSLGVRAHGWNC